MRLPIRRPTLRFTRVFPTRACCLPAAHVRERHPCSSVFICGSKAFCIYCPDVHAHESEAPQRAARRGAQAEPDGHHRRQGPHRRGAGRDRPLVEGARADQGARRDRRSRRAQRVDGVHLREARGASGAADRQGPGGVPRESPAGAEARGACILRAAASRAASASRQAPRWSSSAALRPSDEAGRRPSSACFRTPGEAGRRSSSASFGSAHEGPDRKRRALDVTPTSARAVMPPRPPLGCSIFGRGGHTGPPP